MAKWDFSKLDTRSLAELRSEAAVDRPPHYRNGKLECIDAMEGMVDGSDIPAHQSYLWQNAFKYLWRWPYKNHPVEDLKKAVWYINRLIEKLEEAQNGRSI